MTIKFIGMKDFRKNMAKYSRKKKTNNISYIVLRKNIPIMEVTPISDEDLAYMGLKEQIDEAERQVKNGEFYTADEVRESLGLK